MKKFFYLAGISILFVLASCSDSSTAPMTTDENTGTTASTNPEAERNITNNRAIMKAIETGDSTVIDSLLASDAVDHSGPNGTEMKGDSLKWMLRNMHNEVSDLKMDIIADAANGGYVFTLSRMTGTTKSAGMGMPPNTKMDMTSVDVVKYRDGKAVEHWSYMDPKDMMKMMPAPEK